MTYDPQGNRLTRKDFRGKTTTWGHDLMDRLTSIAPDATLGEPVVTFTYTLTGQRQTMTDGSGMAGYAYDLRDRLSQKQTPAGTLAYGYDPAGNVASISSSHTDGVNVIYAWDAANQLVSVTDNRAPGGMTVANYTLTGQTADVTPPTGLTATYGRDSLDRVTSLAHGPIASPLASYAYALGPAGHRLSVTELSGRSATYGYDLNHRLTSETVAGDPASVNGAVGYSLDPTGNRLARTSTLSPVPAATYAYDVNDRLASDGYDPNGNTVTLDGNSFTYNRFDQPISKNAGSPSEVLLQYDADGTLVSKTTSGVTTKYLVDELNPSGYSQIVEEVVAGAAERVYTHGSMLISQSQLVGATWQTRYFGYDAHGNVTFLTDDAGAITDRYTYDAHGNLAAQTGTTANPYLYGGQRFDADVGLYQLRARWYEPNRGRFVTRDPFEGDTTAPLSLHKYLYAHADPVNLSDPSGLQIAIEYKIALAGAGAAAALTPTTALIGIEGGVTPVRTTLAGALGLHSACLFWAGGTGIDDLLLMPFGREAADPPGIFRYCRVRLPPLVERIRRIGGEFVVPAPNPTPCPPGLRKELHDAVTELCKRPRTCGGLKKCAAIRANLQKNWECAQARDRMNRQCFGGGDKGHKRAVDDALRSIYECEALLMTCTE